MTKEAVESLVDEGIKAVESGDFPLAMARLTEAGERGVERTPQFDAAYAVCLAAVKQQYRQAIDICKWAIELEPCDSGHYLQLGRVYLLADNRKEAIRIFHEGMLYRRDRRIMNELHRIGIRRRPVFDKLPRQHFLNKVAGQVLRQFQRH